MKKLKTIFLSCFVLFLLFTPFALNATKNNTPYIVRTFIDEHGNEIDEVIVQGRPPENHREPAVKLPSPISNRSINILTNVPAFDWCYGCSATSADLGWIENGSAMIWQIEYDEIGFTQENGNIITGIEGNPHNLTGLNVDTNYDFYVRADCGGADYSLWFGPHSFSTIDGKVVNPNPQNNAVDIPIISKTFTWDAVTDADNYLINIGTETGLTDIIANTYCSSNTYTYTGSNWDYLEDYYWTITTDYTERLTVTSDEFKFTTECGPVTPPISQNFDSVSPPALPDCWSVETNVEGWYTYDGYDYSNPNCIRIEYNNSHALDDWFFSSQLQLTGGTTYLVSFRYRARNTSYIERLEVKWGTSATSAGMTGGTIFNEVDFNDNAYCLDSGYFTPASSGIYFVGWHGYSLADQYGIMVDDIEIQEWTAPAPPEIVNLEMVANGDSLKFTWTNEGYFYRLYENAEPYGTVWTKIDSVNNLGQITIPVSENKKFYRITSDNNVPSKGSLPIFFIEEESSYLKDVKKMKEKK
ncbi:MAG: hypothetical protein K8S23_11545 [Candidatus Cloacimonetes bacterium]|nr:hypothetical protein [Candidatus Cloacimonadota bacterium]